MTTTHRPDRTTLAVPQLQRLSYFYGQQLGPLDLQGEQAYLREKQQLANRFLHGWGVVCGLEVGPVPQAGGAKKPPPGLKVSSSATQEPATPPPGQPVPGRSVSGQPAPPQPAPSGQPPSTQPQPGLPPSQEPPKKPVTGPCVVVRLGLALDCHGDEVVLRQPVVLDLWRDLSPEDQQRVRSGHDTLWVSICYCERPVDPARPMYLDACGVPADCAYARIRETVTLRVTLTRPGQPDRCLSCPGDCPDPCVVLARISGFRPGEPLADDQIDNGVRQMLTRHRLTTITGISFVHGATYDRDRASEVLLKGFEVRFSDLVRVSTLTDEVVDIIIYQGGSGQSGRFYPRPGRYEKFPGGDYVDHFVYRQRGDERLEHGDRVLIQVKGDFILDECCRAVDGNHIGGRVPLLPGYERFDAKRPAGCEVSRDRPGAWVSGNGTQGGTFESWFLVENREGGHEQRDRY
jgi:hypothetical protein